MSNFTSGTNIQNQQPLSADLNVTPALVDIDNDGDLDLFVGSSNGTIRYYKNNGSRAYPIFVVQTSLANSLSGVTIDSLSSLTFGDLDQDGDFDLIAGQSSGQLAYLLNTGSKTNPVFSLQLVERSPFATQPSNSNSSNNIFNRFSSYLGTVFSPPKPTFTVYGEGGFVTPTLGDIDADGDLDLLLGDRFGKITYAINSGSATNSGKFLVQTGVNNPLYFVDINSAGGSTDGYSSPYLADFDGDGDLDVAIGTKDGTILYYKNIRSRSQPLYELQTGDANPFNGLTLGSYSHPVLSDLDGDTDLDLLVGTQDGAVRYYINGLPPGSLSVEDLAVTELNSYQNFVNFTVKLSNPYNREIDLKYQISNGTATSGEDYSLFGSASGSGFLTILPGQTSATVGVYVNGDTDFEPDETVILDIQSAEVSGVPNLVVPIAKKQGTLTIVNDDEPLRLSISDYGAYEGNNPTDIVYLTNAFTVSLNKRTSEKILVDYQIVDGTATLNSDYQLRIPVTGTLTFDYETQKFLDLARKGDTDFEGDETVIVNLSNARTQKGTPVEIVKKTGIFTISNDDPATSVIYTVISPENVIEGNSGNKTVEFVVTLDKAIPDTLTLDYNLYKALPNLSDPNYVYVPPIYTPASFGSDFRTQEQQQSGKITFNSGETRKVFAIEVIGDQEIEPSESVSLYLSNPIRSSGGKATTTQGSGSFLIQNDDAVNITFSNISVTEGKQGEFSLANIEVTLDRPLDILSSFELKPDFSKSTADASDLDPFQSVASVYIPKDTTKVSASIRIKGDNILENNETLVMEFKPTSGFNTGDVVATNNAVVTIIDDDILKVSLGNQIDYTLATEASTSFYPNKIRPYNIPVTLSYAETQPVTVEYIVSSESTATQGADFDLSNGSITFAPGETKKDITFYLKDDTLYEPDETIIVQLRNPKLGTDGKVILGNGQTVVTIKDNDQPKLSVVTNTYPRNEGNQGQLTSASFTVIREGSPDETVSVDYSFTGTATPGIDYTATSGKLTFGRGETTKSVPITIIGDNTIELDETIRLELNNPTSSSTTLPIAIGQNAANLTIQNDDRIVISIDDVSVLEGSPDKPNKAIFTVKLNQPSSSTVSFRYRTDGYDLATNTPTNNNLPYIPIGGTLTFATGEISKIIEVQIKGNKDFDEKASEKFRLYLDQPQGAVFDPKNFEKLPDVWIVGRPPTSPNESGAADFTLIDDEPSIRITEIKSLSENLQGVRADYFASLDLTHFHSSGTLPNLSLDKNPIFGKVTGNVSTFSTRLTAKIKSGAEGNYTFFVQTDDRVRLWLNNQLLIDQWQTPTSIGAKEYQAAIALKPEQLYDLRVEYAHDNNNASLKLLWQEPGKTTKELIPSSRLYAADSSGYLADVGYIQMELPAPVEADRGLWIDYNIVGGTAIQGVDYQNSQYRKVSTNPDTQFNGIIIPKGERTGRIYFAAFRNAIDAPNKTIQLEILPSTFSRGLEGQYFNNRNFSGAPVATRLDPKIDFNYGNGKPLPELSSNNFSIRWQGHIRPRKGGEYTFYTNSDEGTRLTINGQVLIDMQRIGDQSALENSGKITLKADEFYDLQLDYYNDQGNAGIQLLWSGPGIEKQIVPQEFLYPTYSDYKLRNSVLGQPIGDGSFLTKVPITLTLEDSNKFNAGVLILDEYDALISEYGFNIPNVNPLLIKDGKAKLKVKLTSQPVSNVTVKLKVAVVVLSNTLEPPTPLPTEYTLTFTPSDWENTKTLIITNIPPADQIRNSPQDKFVAFSVTIDTDSTNNNYHFSRKATYRVTTTPNLRVQEGQGVLEPVYPPLVTTIGGTGNVKEDSSLPLQFVVLLDRPAPVGGVTYQYTLSGSATAGQDYSTSDPLGLTIPEGQIRGEITIVPTADESLETNETVTVTLTNVSEKPYATLAILNDDIPRIEVVNAVITTDPTTGETTTTYPGAFNSLETSETGNSETIGIRLSTQPTQPITINLKGLDASEGFFSTTKLIFTSENWNQYQNVTVFGVDDPVKDGDITYTVQATAAADRSSPFYGHIFPISITNLDNDTEVDNRTNPPPPKIGQQTLADIDQNLPLATLSVVDASNSTVNEDSGTAVRFRVQLDKTADRSIVVYLSDNNSTSDRHDITPLNRLLIASQTAIGDSPFDSIDSAENTNQVLDVGDNSKPTFADLDNDGDFDLIVGAKTGQLQYYQNTGTPGRAIYKTIADTAKINPFSVYNTTNLIPDKSPAILDINGDGKPDVVLSQGTGQLLFFKNFGQPGQVAFPITSQPIGTGQPTVGINPVLVDLGQAPQGVSLLVQQGDQLKHYIATTTNQQVTFLPQSNIATVSGTVRPAAIDWDLDGDQDLLVGKADGKIDYYLNTGSPQQNIWQLRNDLNPLNGVDVGENAAPAAVDLNSDGYQDVVVGSADGKLHYFENYAGVTIAPGQQSVEFEVKPVADTVVEPDEVLKLSLNRNTGYRLNNPLENIAVTIKNDDTAGVNLQASATTITEGGYEKIRLDVKLTTQPTAPVVVYLGSNRADKALLQYSGDENVLRKQISKALNESREGLSQFIAARGAQSALPLVFTPENWNQIQSLEVVPQDDNVADGIVPVPFQIVVTTTSEDQTYQKLAVTPLNLASQDGLELPGSGGQISPGDTAGLVITDLASTTEGRSGAFTVKLSSQPLKDVQVTITPKDEQIQLLNRYSFQPVTLTFTPDNWFGSQTVQFSAVDDIVVEPLQQSAFGLTIASTDPLYAALNGKIEDKKVTILDNDLPIVSLNPGLSGSELSSTPGYFTVQLNYPTLQNSTGINVNYEILTSSTAENSLDYQPIPQKGTIRIAPGENLGSLNFIPLDDKIVEAKQETIVVRLLPGEGYTLNSEFTESTITLQDDDEPGIQVLQPGTYTAIEEGKTTQIFVSLLSEPTAPVTITLNAPTRYQEQYQIGLSESQTPPQTRTLTFTKDNWYLLQPVTVQAIEDGIAEDEQPFQQASVNFQVQSTDLMYNNFLVDPIDVRVSDRYVEPQVAASAPAQAMETVQKAMENLSIGVLGKLEGKLPGFLGKLGPFIQEQIQKQANPTPPTLKRSLQEALRSIEIGGVKLFGDIEPIVRTIVTPDDKTLTQIELTKTFNLFDIDLTGDMGVPALGLNIKGKVKGNFEFKILLTYGFDAGGALSGVAAQGLSGVGNVFFIDTDHTKAEVKLNLVLDDQFQGQGNLGPVRLDFANKTDDPSKVEVGAEIKLRDLDTQSGVVFFDTNSNGLLDTGEAWANKKSGGKYYTTEALKVKEPGYTLAPGWIPETKIQVNRDANVIARSPNRTADPFDTNKNGLYDDVKQGKRDGVYRRTSDGNTYYFDANRNEQLDVGEPSTTNPQYFNNTNFEISSFSTGASGSNTKSYYVDFNKNNIRDPEDPIINKSLDRNNNKQLDPDVDSAGEGRIVNGAGIAFVDVNNNLLLDEGEPFVNSAYEQFRINEKSVSYLDLNDNAEPFGREPIIRQIALQENGTSVSYRYLDFNGNKIYDSNFEPKARQNEGVYRTTIRDKVRTYYFDTDGNYQLDPGEPYVLEGLNQIAKVTESGQTIEYRYLDFNRNGKLDGIEPRAKAGTSDPLTIANNPNYQVTVYREFYLDLNGNGKKDDLEPQGVGEGSDRFLDLNRNGEKGFFEPVRQPDGSFVLPIVTSSFPGLGEVATILPADPTLALGPFKLTKLSATVNGSNVEYDVIDFNKNNQLDDNEPRRKAGTTDAFKVQDGVASEETRYNPAFLDFNGNGQRDVDEPQIIAPEGTNGIKVLDLNRNGRQDNFEPKAEAEAEAKDGRIIIPETTKNGRSFIDLNNSQVFEVGEIFTTTPWDLNTPFSLQLQKVDFLRADSQTFKWKDNQDRDTEYFINYLDLNRDSKLQDNEPRNGSLFSTISGNYYLPASVEFLDLNGDSKKDAYEPQVLTGSNSNRYLDLNKNDQQDTFEPISKVPEIFTKTPSLQSESTFRNLLGNYAFELRGFDNVLDLNGNGFDSEDILIKTNVPNTINTKPASGILYLDKNGNNLLDVYGGEQVYAGLDSNNNRVLDADAPLTLVDSNNAFLDLNGNSQLDEFEPQALTINNVRFLDWNRNNQQDSFEVRVQNGQFVLPETRKTFLDYDQNDQLDQQEWQVIRLKNGSRFLDLNNNKVLDPGEASAISDDNPLRFPQGAIILGSTVLQSNTNVAANFNQNGLYIDINGNRQQDSEEPLIRITIDPQGRSVRYVDLNNNNKLDTVNLKTKTGQDALDRDVQSIFIEPFSYQNNEFNLDLITKNKDGKEDLQGGKVVTFQEDYGRLTLTELYNVFKSSEQDGYRFSDLPEYKLAGESRLNLKAQTSFAGDTAFPSVNFDFNLNYPLFNYGNSTEVSANGLSAQLQNVQLDFGSFVTKFLKPTFTTVNQVIDPIKPLIRVLNQDTKLFTYLGATSQFDKNKDGKVSILEMAAFFIPLAYQSKPIQEREKVEKSLQTAIKYADLLGKIAEITELITKVPENENIKLDFGSFDLTGVKASNPVDSNGVSQPQNLNSLVQNTDKKADPLTQANNNSNGIVKTIIQKLGALEGLEIPLAKDPGRLIQVLLSGDPANSAPIDLLKYTPPQLDLNFNASASVPLGNYYGVDISAEIQGSVNARTDLRFGFDSYGLQQWYKKDFALKDSYLALDGFYLDDLDNSGKDKPELSVDARLVAGLGVSPVIVKGILGGGLKGTLGLDLRDKGEETKTNDGKLRGSEILGSIKNPLDLFALSGALEAFLNAQIEITGYGKVWSKDFGNTKVAEFKLDSNKGFRYALEGKAVDGYIINGLVFLDANFNGELDEGEPVTITDQSGEFDLELTDSEWNEFDVNGDDEITLDEGRLALRYGYDASSGLPFEGLLTAPPEFTEITPFTSLIERIARKRGISSEESERFIEETWYYAGNSTYPQLEATDPNVLITDPSVTISLVSLTPPGGFATNPETGQVEAIIWPPKLDDESKNYLIGAQMEILAEQLSSFTDEDLNTVIDQIADEFITKGQQGKQLDLSELPLEKLLSNLPAAMLISSAISAFTKEALEVGIGQSYGFASKTYSIYNAIFRMNGKIQALGENLETFLDELQANTAQLTVAQFNQDYTTEALNQKLLAAPADSNVFLPKAADVAFSINEDTEYVFKVSDFGYSDPDGNSFESIYIDELLGFGFLTLDDASIGKGDEIEVADIEAGKLKFRPYANGWGVNYITLVYSVFDGELYSEENTFTISVDSVNDLPTIKTNQNVVLLAGETQLIDTNLLEVTDADNIPSEVTFEILELPVNGQLLLSGQPLQVGSQFSQQDIDESKLSYTDNGNYFGSDRFFFSVTDPSGGKLEKAQFNFQIVPTDLLARNTDNVFFLGGKTNKDVELIFTPNTSQSNRANDLAVFVVDDQQGRIDGILPSQPEYIPAAIARARTIFSSVSRNLFNPNAEQRLTFHAGEQFGFLMVSDGTLNEAEATLAAGNLPENVIIGFPYENGGFENYLIADKVSQDQFLLRWEDTPGGGDRDYDDAVLTVRVAPDAPSNGITPVLGNQELIDLRSFNSQINVGVTIQSEANFNNLLGFYAVDDLTGQINGIMPGDSRYAQAALSRQVGVMSNRSQDGSIELNGGSIFAPFLIANGTIEQFLSQNPSNQSLESTAPMAYFGFLGANTDKIDHFRTFGKNCFGVEDLFGGGDKDFNDINVQLQFLPS
ncbi:VCBS repeat-containing protein [Tolypothrix sp. FACHB-123]|uniref:Calx-beta domain-containing protein n=1 Tax=Tolypothrix sp. FACHB-123 TaxID=2692868 RepID=UPI0016845D8F|nr:Calx-beta domain-containing protein [Tolypothrix sp. FACHB-123]MBD2357452.1 VCBS repeat-containing protein [Tolypothrix sp. FACHB-123]